MRAGLAWSGNILVSMATCAVLASAGALAAQGDSSSATPAQPGDVRASPVRVTLEGFVLAPDGSPSEGAVVVSSAGGRAVADVAGNYRLEVEVPLEATSLQVTAVGRAGGNQSASTSAVVTAWTSTTRVDPLRLALGASCSPSWLPTFGGIPGTSYTVRALAVHDDGSGPALYVGGEFSAAGGVLANKIARWDGSSWSALGSGMGGASPRVHALAVHDDGSGPALYAGGTFTTAGGVAANNVARWDGSSWAAVGSGTGNFGTLVNALAVFDDGSGPTLFAGGAFSFADGQPANNVARWDGSSWVGLQSPLNDVVHALTVFDDGSGPASLYAGGEFTTAGGQTANRIASWDGSSWAALGSGTNGAVFALAVHDDGGGPALYAGGGFTSAGGVPANNVARWDGSSWAAVGSGLGNTVFALAVYDDGSGPALYAGGSFVMAGGQPASRVARWNGSSWAGLQNPLNGFVYALLVLDLGGGSALYAGGGFTTAGGQPADFIAKWDGSSWTTLGSGLSGSFNALVVHDDGSGPALYGDAGGVTPIAKWDGSSWSALGSEVGGSVSALAVYDDGSGPALYAGGNFTIAGNRIAKWSGSGWSGLGSGMNSDVRALAVYNDGGGPALYAGGGFTTAGGVPAKHIAKWNGSSWSALGSGVGFGDGSGSVYALVVYDDGSGPALYAGGAFTTAGGVPAKHIAKWNGTSWSALASGMSGGASGPTVYALAVHGPALYAGGEFTTAGGVPANRIAKWNGSSWSALGSGMSGADSVQVMALAVYDDGSGSALYAGGGFTTAGGVPANRIAKWNGSNWAALGSGSGVVLALAVYDDGGGPALYAAGGLFIDSGDYGLAKWGFPPDLDPPTLACPSSVIVRDELSSPPGEVVSFSVTASDCRDPAPSVVCVPPSGSFFPRGTTLVTCSATDASGNEATCHFPVTVAPKARPR